MRYAMEFENPVFNEGLNITVRFGMKWIETLRIGDTLYLLKPKERATADRPVGEVLGIACIPWDNLPAEWLEYEHDQECRDLAGLHRCLTRIYGPIDRDTLLTVVFFKLREKR